MRNISIRRDVCVLMKVDGKHRRQLLGVCLLSLFLLPPSVVRAQALKQGSIILTGPAGWHNMPVGTVNSQNNTFTVANNNVGAFGSWSATPGVTRLIGDFDGDGKDDVALIGAGGWASIPIAFSSGTGAFTITNFNVDGVFASRTMTPGVKFLVGDFNGDGKADIALVGPAVNTVPIAFSNGDGTFRVTNANVSGFAGFATNPGAKVLVGDFDGDGRTDMALAGPAEWNSMPIAFSNGDGTFRVTNNSVGAFAGEAATPGAKIVVGDFNGDYKADIALVGASGWASIPIAFSNGDGSFYVTNADVGPFAEWAASPGVKVLIGNFSGRLAADIALVGGSGWASVPVAFSNGDGTFDVRNNNVPGFAGFATNPGAQVVVADFDGNGKSDIALVGPSGWNTVPIAFSNGDGTFNATNNSAPQFAAWAGNPATVALSRSFAK